VNNNKITESDMVINFINSNNEDEVKDLYKNLAIFDDFIDWDEVKEEEEKVTPFGNFGDYKISLDVDCKMLYLKKYDYDNGYLIAKDIVFRKDINHSKGIFYAMYNFDILYSVKENDGEFMINRLVSRDISYNGRDFLERDPIYYGENYSNINNNEDVRILRKVLTK